MDTTTAKENLNALTVRTHNVIETVRATAPTTVKGRYFAKVSENLAYNVGVALGVAQWCNKESSESDAAAVAFGLARKLFTDLENAAGKVR